MSSTEDWLKARTALPRDPRVLTMATLLVARPDFVAWRDASRDSAVTVGVTVTALLVTWGVVRKQGHPEGDDVVVSHCTTATLDAIAGVPAFGEAMVRIGWAVPHEDGSMRFPRFMVENATQDGIRREKDAERQRRRRALKAAAAADAQAATEADCDSASASSDTSRDGHATTSARQDKSRQEKTTHTEEDAAAGAAAALAPPGPELFVRDDASGAAPVGGSIAHVQFAAWWEGEYRSVLGTPYKASWKKDGPALRDLLQTFSLEELKVRAVRWLTTDQAWISQTDRGMALFASKVNMPALLAKKPGKGRGGGARTGRVDPAPEDTYGNGRVEL